ncbi:conserved protein of unknown function (plasmid) [Rhodovastum atsumiense]|uniref:Uncharacterized protein n=1 Tax=Rhodovastum atsumiense TaxID=504468 RepID=A0A5M6IT96_9PROT|nr:hypothetical protein [Rhodovastum atsumiense]KAA5611540.1 hypothetical protein F1189_13315 [Rhodovastum atsumiense]CAH2606234.1 conserved protein of unknown function [Rhodovastum atsumiense]
MSEHHPSLRDEVEAAVLAELARVGPEAFSKAEIARRFADRGASRATLYRYIDGPLKSGKAGQHVAREVKAAVEARAKLPDPPAAAAQAAAAKLPALVTVDDIASSGGVIPVIEKLVGCIGIAEQLIAHARTEDGKVRSAKLLLSASEHMRRNLETAVRLQEAMRQAEEMERFHRRILGMVRGVAREHPEAAQAIISGLGQLAAEWGG